MIEILHNLLQTAGKLSVELLIVGALFFAIEKIRPAEKKTPFIKSDSKEELGLAFLNTTLCTPLFHAAIAIFLLGTVKEFIPYQIFASQLTSLPVILQILAACFIMDFSTYWRHRTTHRVKFLWPFHSIHHAAERLNWLTAMRLHPIDIFMATLFDVFVLHIFGFDAAGIVFAVLTIKLFNYFTHANIDLKFAKPIRYIFVSPNFHR